MKKILKILVCASFVLVFLGCVGAKSPQIKQESKAVSMLIISPLARINDSGFVHFNKNSTLIQIYSAGAGLFELKIADKICINGACQTPALFNERFFGASYYDGILADIIASKPLFGAKTSPNDCGGFNQSFSDITYEVCANKTSFKNKKAKIVFGDAEF